MDRAGIEFCIRSLTSPGVQSLPNRNAAIKLARSANDELAAAIRQHPDGLSGFAAVPMQDPAAAAAELERAVTEFGFRGALINGYTNRGDDAKYLDDLAVGEFWARSRR